MNQQTIKLKMKNSKINGLIDAKLNILNYNFIWFIST